jgi:hypothetical protein
MTDKSATCSEGTLKARIKLGNQFIHIRGSTGTSTSLQVCTSESERRNVVGQISLSVRLARTVVSFSTKKSFHHMWRRVLAGVRATTFHDTCSDNVGMSVRRVPVLSRYVWLSFTFATMRRKNAICTVRMLPTQPHSCACSWASRQLLCPGCGGRADRGFTCCNLFP